MCTAEEGTYEVSAMGVELSSVIVGLEVDLGLVNEADDHDVVGGGDVLDTKEGTVGDDTSAMARLGAPSNFTSFTGANSVVGLAATPHAEVGNVIHKHCLEDEVQLACKPLRNKCCGT